MVQMDGHFQPGRNDAKETPGNREYQTYFNTTGRLIIDLADFRPMLATDLSVLVCMCACVQRFINF